MGGDRSISRDTGDKGSQGWIRPEKATAVEMDHVIGRVGDPYLGFPRNVRAVFSVDALSGNAVTYTSPGLPF
jgi:hypothetical protein